MSAIVDAFLAELDEDALDELADRLAPRLAGRLNGTQPADRWLRGADAIAEHLGCPRSRVYSLVSAGRIPVHRDGSNLCARANELDEWLRAGGAKRP